MMATATEVRVPDIGAFENVPIIELHVKVGDQVNEEDPLVTLESDKATMDIPAPLAGQVVEIPVKIGDEVSTGSLILTIDAGDGSGHAPADAGRAAGARRGRVRSASGPGAGDRP